MKRNNRGFTIVELVITMALIAIVSALVITFTVLLANRVKVAQNEKNAIAQLSDIEIGLKNWIMHYDNADFDIVDDNDKLIAQKGGVNTCELKLNDDKSALVSSGETVCELNNVISVRFQTKISSITGKKLIYAYIDYYLPNTNNEQTSTLSLTFSTHHTA